MAGESLKLGLNFWLMTSRVLLESSRRSMYMGSQEQKERSEIDGLWCM